MSLGRDCFKLSISFGLIISLFFALTSLGETTVSFDLTSFELISARGMNDCFRLRMRLVGLELLGSSLVFVFFGDSLFCRLENDILEMLLNMTNFLE